MDKILRKSRSERGQAMVLLVLGLVGLLGFAALAIDGSMIYSDRRIAQNAADAASLAGGGRAAILLENSAVVYKDWNCNLSSVKNAMKKARLEAIGRAGSNDFSIDEDISDHHGVVTECHVVDNGSYVDKYIDVKVNLTIQTQTAFAHFVYSGPLINNVEAVTRIRPRGPVGFGNAIVSLNESCGGSGGGILIDGSEGVAVTGGGIFSNSCIDMNGSSGTVQVSPPHTITYVDGYNNNGGKPVSPPPRDGDVKMPDFSINPPDCSSLPDKGAHSGDGTIHPGRYDRIRLNNGELTMNAGLYCVSGDFTVNGGILHGENVTIYITPNGDSFSTAGNAEVILSSPPSDCEVTMPSICGPAMPGMLIYLGPGNTKTVTLQGNSDSKYLGMVFAPDGMIDVGGSSSEISTVNAQLVGDSVKVHGSVTVDINFQGELVFNRPAYLELFK